MIHDSSHSRGHVLAAGLSGVIITLLTILLLSLLAMLDENSHASCLAGSDNLTQILRVLCLILGTASVISLCFFSVWSVSSKAKRQARLRVRAALVVNVLSWMVLLVLWLWLGLDFGAAGWSTLGLLTNLSIAICNAFGWAWALQNAFCILALVAVSGILGAKGHKWLVPISTGQAVICMGYVVATLYLMEKGYVHFSDDVLMRFMDPVSFVALIFFILLSFAPTIILWSVRPEDIDGQQAVTMPIPVKVPSANGW